MGKMVDNIIWYLKKSASKESYCHGGESLSWIRLENVLQYPRHADKRYYHDGLICTSPYKFYRNRVLLLENYRMTLEFLAEDETVWSVDKFLDRKVDGGEYSCMRDIIENASEYERLSKIYDGLRLKFDDMIIDLWGKTFPKEVPEPCEWGPAQTPAEYERWKENGRALSPSLSGREFPNTKLIHFITD